MSSELPCPALLTYHLLVRNIAGGIMALDSKGDVSFQFWDLPKLMACLTMPHSKSEMF